MRQTGSLVCAYQCSLRSKMDWGGLSVSLWMHLVRGRAAAATITRRVNRTLSVPFPPRCLWHCAWEKKKLTACFVLSSGVLASLRDCRHRRRETGHSDGLLSTHTLSQFQRATDFYFLFFFFWSSNFTICFSEIMHHPGRGLVVFSLLIIWIIWQ